MAGFLKKLGMTLEQLEFALEASPSLRGMLVGYLAEIKLVEMYFKHHSPIKYDDHDRKRKGDRWIEHEGAEISIEVKSLQSNSVKETADGFEGRFQCDASDSREVTLPNGDKVKTVCLVVGGFDLLAINLFEFGQYWKYAFVRNKDLPRSTYRKYTPEQRKHLLQTTPKITWPLEPPFCDQPWALLDEIAREKSS